MEKTIKGIVIKGAIFDIDGTLLDSMPIWENVGARYLATLGIKAKPDLKERLDALSLPEGAIYMQKEYGLSVSASSITGISALPPPKPMKPIFNIVIVMEINFLIFILSSLTVVFTFCLLSDICTAVTLILSYCLSLYRDIQKTAM